MPGIDSIIEQSQRNFAEVLARLLKNGPVTPIHYQRYLSMQYHLTRGVQRYFIAAAAHPDLVSRKRLRRFLFEFANEEELHYLVAANDLFRSALPLLPMPFDVELWHAYFNATVAERPFLRLGAACILENIAEGEAKPLVRRALAAPFLNRENTKFLVLHQHESLPHGAQLLDALGGAHLDEPQLADLLEGARKGAVFYLRMAEWALFPDCAAAAADARDGAVTAAERKAIEAFSMEQLAT